jgi:hypothetical protein
MVQNPSWEINTSSDSEGIPTSMKTEGLLLSLQEPA